MPNPRKIGHFLRKDYLGSDSVAIRAGRHLLEGSYTPHDHDFMEVAVIVKGQAVHKTVKGDRRIGPGDVFVLRPRVWHAYLACHCLDVYNCCFGAELLERELAWLYEDPLLNHVFWTGPLALDRQGIIGLRLPSRSLKACLQHLDALNQITCLHSINRHADQIGYLLLFLGELVRNMGAAHRAPSERTARGHWATHEGRRLLESAPAYPWTLPALANRLHLERSYLARLFRAGVGMSPMAYLARRRAELAAKLLAQTDWPVAAIGKRVGWPDGNYFSRRFRRYFGVSPTVYRSRLTRQ